MPMNRMDHFALDSSARLVIPTLCGLFVAGLAFAATASLLSVETADYLFSEEGPVEDTSEWLWVALAVMLPITFRSLRLVVIAGMLIFLACGAREASFHTAFTDYSVLKIPFYYRPEHQVAAQVVAAIAMLLLAASVAIVASRLLKLIRSGEHRHAAWPYFALVGAAMLIGSKVLDRSPAILRDTFDIHLSETTLLVCGALEEGYEMLLPVVISIAILTYRRHQQRSARPCRAGINGPPHPTSTEYG